MAGGGRRMRWIALAALVAALVALPAGTSAAQTSPPAGQAPAAPGAQPPAPAAPKPSEVYSYNPEGRRDPFVSLLLRGGADLATSRDKRPDGREGILIAELALRGIVRSRNALVAMVQGPDNRTYIIHTGDRLLDGVVKAITADTVVFSQDVNDPLSLVKQREVRKMLRASEEVK